MKKRNICLILTALILLFGTSRLLCILPFQLIYHDTYLPPNENQTCVIISNENALKQYSLKSMLSNVDFDFAHNSYIISPGHELKKIKKENLHTHFVQLYLNGKKTDQLFVYEVKNKKIYLDDRSGKNVRLCTIAIHI